MKWLQRWQQRHGSASLIGRIPCQHVWRRGSIQSALWLISAGVVLASPSTSLANEVWKAVDPDPLHVTELPPDDELGCTANRLFLNHDMTAEGAYAWVYSGVQGPTYGAFAECFEGGERLCEAQFYFARVGEPEDATFDAYVWSESGVDRPSAVLAAVVGVSPGDIAEWPEVSRHSVSFSIDLPEQWWLGFWGNWPGEDAAWFLAADEDGPGGCPRTNYAPGNGYPTGWNHPDIVFGWENCKALAIQASVIEAASGVTDSDIGGPFSDGRGTNAWSPGLSSLIAFPNPTNGTTRIRYRSPSNAPAPIEVFDSSGRLVRSLHFERNDAEVREVQWDGRNDLGQAVSSGVYFARTSGEATPGVRITLIR